jgi:ribose 5-phosphate isomerase B
MFIRAGKGTEMKIAIGTDHRGLELKRVVKEFCEKSGHTVQDLGADGAAAVDYPDFAEKVARAVADGKADRGILICGTGIGMCITANKVHGVRAASCWDTFSARRSREHNDANVLCLGNDMIAAPLAEEIVKVWLAAAHEGGRHQRRVEKIMAIERNDLERREKKVKE